MQCWQCGAQHIVYDHGDYTCTACGLVLEAHTLVDDYQSVADRTYPCIQKNTHNTRMYRIEQLFALLSQRHHIHKAILQEAKTIFQQAHIQLHIKGHDRNITLAAVALYIASMRIPGAAYNKHTICDIYDIDKYTFAQLLAATQQYIPQQRQSHVQDIIHRFINQVTNQNNHKQNIRNTAQRIIHRIEHQPTIQNISHINIAATIIVMAVKIHKINITTTHIAISCDISIATIINTEKTIKQLLTKQT